MHSKLSIIIPAYNEDRTIDDVLKSIMAVELPYQLKKECIIVDDCSNDDTVKFVEDFKVKNLDFEVHLIQHNANKGKGASIQTAISQVTGDLVIFQDADLECDPKDYVVLIEELVESKCNVVYGNRFSKQNSAHKRSLHYIINRLLTKMSNLKTGLSLTDMECCYKLMESSLLKKLELKEQRFGIEPEITAKLSKLTESKFTEVPISYSRRSYNSGKKIGWKDGIRALYCTLKY
ncbi:glycosyltransferase family 2 protein [Crocinitomicaceae bacterium]|nr:glycosyltransferase family 2 protein [Crocinitomicaceae bacterium]